MYFLHRTFSVIDANGVVVPDVATAPGRASYQSWLAAGNVPTFVDNTGASGTVTTTTPPPATTTTAKPFPWSLCLSDLMDTYYGAGVWTKRTGVGIGSDITPALTAGCQSIRANGGGRGEITIPPGLWLMNGSVAPDILAGVRIVGLGSQASIIVYNSNAGSAFTFSGAAGYTGGGLRGIGLLLEDGHPASTATMISMQGDVTFQADQFVFSDLYMSALGNSYWYNGINAYGNARISPQGIRVASIDNVQVFRCSNTGVYLSNVVQWTISNLGCYAGTGSGNNIYLAGGGATNTNTTQIYITGISCVDLNLTNCSYFDISGKVQSVSTNATATNGTVRAPGATLNGVFGVNAKLN